jgi:Tfp pilus assembly protein PilX
MALVLAMCILMLVTLTVLSGTQTALQAMKSARQQRDRQVAFQAAEAALADAEVDIEGGADGASARAALFAPGSAVGFVAACGDGVNLGLCQSAAGIAPPLWQGIDLAGDSARTVAYGSFTGAAMPTGQGTLPARLPRYIIELVPLAMAGEDAAAPSCNFYRITAIGFGARPQTQVVLQTYYRKLNATEPP